MNININAVVTALAISLVTGVVTGSISSYLTTSVTVAVIKTELIQVEEEVARNRSDIEKLDYLRIEEVRQAIMERVR